MMRQESDCLILSGLHRVFDPSLSVISNSGLLLGVRSKNVDYLTNEDGSVTAFYAEWRYLELCTGYR